MEWLHRQHAIRQHEAVPTAEELGVSVSDTDDTGRKLPDWKVKQIHAKTYTAKVKEWQRGRVEGPDLSDLFVPTALLTGLAHEGPRGTPMAPFWTWFNDTLLSQMPPDLPATDYTLVDMLVLLAAVLVLSGQHPHLWLPVAPKYSYCLQLVLSRTPRAGASAAAVRRDAKALFVAKHVHRSALHGVEDIPPPAAAAADAGRRGKRGGGDGQGTDEPAAIITKATILTRVDGDVAAGVVRPAGLYRIDDKDDQLATVGDVLQASYAQGLAYRERLGVPPSPRAPFVVAIVQAKLTVLFHSEKESSLTLPVDNGVPAPEEPLYPPDAHGDEYTHASYGDGQYAGASAGYSAGYGAAHSHGAGYYAADGSQQYDYAGGYAGGYADNSQYSAAGGSQAYGSGHGADSSGYGYDTGYYTQQ